MTLSNITAIPPRIWVRALTAHPYQTILSVVEILAKNWQINYQVVPQSGLNLLQLEDGVFHEPYYLGEIPVASAQIEIINERGESFVGAAQVMNDSADLAVVLAVCDAVMAHQLPGWQQVAQLIQQGAEQRLLEELQRGAMLTKTKVDFSLLSQEESHAED